MPPVLRQKVKGVILCTMSLKDFFKGLFKKSPKSAFPKDGSLAPLTQQIASSMELLVQKTEYLGENFSSETESIKKISEQVKTLTPLDDIASAKYEQDILGKITAVSSACNSVIAGKHGANIAKALSSLQAAVTSRLGMQE